MKRFILLLLIAVTWSFQAEASHILGGDIQYKYVGDSTGVTGQYRVKLVIYRQQTGVGLGTAQTVNITSSSCNVSTNLSCTLSQPEFSAASLGAYDCISNTNSTFTPMVNIYIGYVILTQSCNDYVMYWQSCCRPPGITGIVNSASQGFYFEAELNNTLGYNSSPVFLSTPLAYICIGGHINYLQNAHEFDGDSINYELVPAREFAFGTGGVSVPYSAGYTFLDPIHTSTLAPFTLDSKSGNISFIAIQAETSVIALRVNEYRYDSTYLFWEKVGSSNREIQVSVASNCNPIVNQGVKLDQNAPGVSLDAQGRQQVDYNCLDSAVMLHFTLGVECISVSPDGSDFRLTAPSGQPIPIDQLQTFCDVNGETDSLRVKLFKPLSMNGDYYLYSKIGNDGNTLLNKCGKDMNEYDTIILHVTDCVDWVMDVTNVTIDDDINPHVYWDVDSIAFADFAHLFNSFRVWRSDDAGATFNVVTNLSDSSLRDFADYSLGGIDVDAQHYRYRLEAFVNGLSQPLSNVGNSIWLRGDMTDTENIPVVWNHYNVWPTPQYQVEFGRNVTGNPGQYQWEEYNNPITDTFATVSHNSLPPGQYAVRVRTANANRLIDTAYSNWIEFGEPVPPIPPVDSLVVPNVITPNGSGQNDNFIIQGIMSYTTTRHLIIMNRYGHIVYENDQYDNANPWQGRDQSGRLLADGTYFYVLRVKDNPNAISGDTKGSITLLTK
ncbi:MAG: gliding motility-associated C-terminal domain-containing protein [Schleiferiaceae bacterium]|nr:gliding motility-associated C-terminal domain-containing protein [Schleiferiaceae bacterium]MDG2225166.1 gliding motility-associated C-terminal domain-containing protein [Schleiferiaceae bacterium]